MAGLTGKRIPNEIISEILKTPPVPLLSVQNTPPVDNFHQFEYVPSYGYGFGLGDFVETGMDNDLLDRFVNGDPPPPPDQGLRINTDAPDEEVQKFWHRGKPPQDNAQARDEDYALAQENARNGIFAPDERLERYYGIEPLPIDTRKRMREDDPDFIPSAEWLMGLRRVIPASLVGGRLRRARNA
jgi:hypothetical protein